MPPSFSAAAIPSVAAPFKSGGGTHTIAWTRTQIGLLLVLRTAFGRRAPWVRFITAVCMAFCSANVLRAAVPEGEALGKHHTCEKVWTRPGRMEAWRKLTLSVNHADRYALRAVQRPEGQHLQVRCEAS